MSFDEILITGHNWASIYPNKLELDGAAIITVTSHGCHANFEVPFSVNYFKYISADYK